MRTTSTLLFLLVAAVGCSYFGLRLAGDDQREFQPGELSYAHHQLALKCESCHDGAFGGDAVIEERCISCHGGSMKAIGDAHGPKKFADPRNAGELDVLDASRCLSCHKEHVPEQTRAMQVTQPADFCMACHSDIAEVRVSHIAVEPTSCTNAGCHNYHDNSTLYEAFLAAHANEPAQLKSIQLLPRTSTHKASLQADWQQLQLLQHAETPAKATHTEVAIKHATDEWQASAHAKGHANCSDCHRAPDTSTVTMDVCAECHKPQWQALQLGHHAMRLAVGLDPMKVDMAQLAMHPDAADKQLTCNSCHSPHRYDTTRAQAESCLGCHQDEHSSNWRQSQHATLWQSDPNNGASCATCHMPREKVAGEDGVHVQHNQSANLRPNDKMLKTVCMRCHGLEYAMSALADTRLIQQNFATPASGKHQSIDWARQHAATEKTNPTTAP